MKTIKKIASSRALYIVLACILSVILWLYVASYANTDMEAELTGLEINYVGGDDILRDRKLLVTEKDQQSVSLTILGKRNVVSAIKKDEVEVSVDLTDIRSTGVYEKVYTVTFPDSVKEDAVLIVKRSPEYVTVNIDNLITKPVEVRGDFEGSVQDGYMQEPIVYEPATIMVSGPEEVVSHIACARVVLDRENLNRTVTGSVSYTLLDYEDKPVDTRELSMDVEEVKYTIPIVMVKDIVLTVDLIEGGGAKATNAVVEVKPNVLTVTGDAELIQGISPEFYRQIEWLPGGRVEKGQLLFDPLYDEYQRTRDPELADLCDLRVRSIIFNLMRLFGSIDYVNVGRIPRSLLRKPIAGVRRGSVYIVQYKEVSEPLSRVFILRFQKWGIAEHLDEGKDLLTAILEANDYADYIMDRRLACRQLGMNLPRNVGFGQFTEKYTGQNQYFGTTVRAYYYVR